MQHAVDQVNASIREAATGADVGRRAALEADITRLTAEIDRLTDLFASVEAAPVKAKLIERSKLLRAKQDELAALDVHRDVVRVLPQVSGGLARAPRQLLRRDLRP